MGFVDFRDSHIDVKAVVQLLLHAFRLKDDAHGQDVINLFERHMLGLHFIPDGIDRFDAGQDMVFQSHLIQLGTDRCGKLCKDLVAFSGCLFQLAFNLLILLGVFILETEILKLGLDLIQSQAMGQWGVDIECFASYFELFVGLHGAQGAHVVQAVCYLDENHADIVAHGEQ